MTSGIVKQLIPSSHAVTLRPVCAQDGDLLFQLYASIREHELAVVNWDDATKEAFLQMQFQAQQTYYQSYCSHDDHHVIEIDGTPVGRIYLSYSHYEIRLLDITLLPMYRNQGIGTALLQDVIHQAETSKRPIQLYVFRTNEGAFRFYQRFGFTLCEDTGVHFLMEWSPA
ncbi:MAG: N-acetyltransferase [Chloroflexi bacterium AL-N5]|nr:N-acetyltransferase [Chloroflexi bacterium AL-N5]